MLMYVVRRTFNSMSAAVTLLSENNLGTNLKYKNLTI